MAQYPGQYPGQYGQQPQYPGQQRPQYPQQYPGTQYPQQPQQYPGTQQYPPQQYPGTQQYPSSPPQQYPGTQQYPTQQYPGTQQFPGTQYPGTQQYPNPSSPYSPQYSLSGWGQSFYNMINSVELQSLQAWFTSINRTGSGAIYAEELATANFGGQPLGMKAAKKLIAAFDKDRNGTIEFAEYAALHKFITKMQQAFSIADANRSGFLDFREIHNAISTGGFNISLQTVQSICQKFDKSGRGISMSDFILICAHLATVRSIFEWNDPSNKGTVTLNYDQFAHVTVHLMED